MKQRNWCPLILALTCAACAITADVVSNRTLAIDTITVDIWTDPRIVALERLAARARGKGMAGPLAGIAEEKANKIEFTSARDVDFGPFMGAVETDAQCELHRTEICAYFSLSTSGPVLRWSGAGWKFCGGACDATRFAWIAVSGP
jgi:hypothetical protein